MLVATPRDGRCHGDLTGRRQGFEQLPDRGPFTFRNEQTQIQLVGFDLAGDDGLRRPIANRGLNGDITPLQHERQPLEFDLVTEKLYAGIEVL